MSALREEIRAILREELGALRREERQVERVRIATSADLNRFAQDLIRRASSPDFAAQVASGALVFDLAAAPASAPIGAPINAPIVSGPARTPPAMIEKPLITERDIATLGEGARSLRLAPGSRLTPLARDEARRKGIRIERAER